MGPPGNGIAGGRKGPLRADVDGGSMGGVLLNKRGGRVA